MLRRIVRHRALLAVAALLLSGCAGSDGGGSSAPLDASDQDTSDQGDAGTGVPDASLPSPACERSPELIAEKKACLDDDLCPCGTHCDLGQCIATCLDDAGCSDGERCDDFGRCVPAGQTSKVAPFAPGTGGRVETSPSALRMAPGGASHRVRLDRAGDAGGRARVVGRGGIEVRCAPGDEFGGECLVADVPSAGMEIELRRAPDKKADEATATAGAAGAAVFDESGHVSFVGVVEADTAPQAEHTGRYEGFVWVQSQAQVAGPGEAGEPTLGVLDFGRGVATVRVYGSTGAYTVEVVDRDGAVFAGPLALAATRAEDGTLSATLPAMPLYARESADGEAAEISLPSTASVAGQLDAGLVELHFDAPLLGLDFEGAGVPVRLVVSATRVDDLPEGASAPPVTVDVDPTLDLARGMVPSPAFALARSLADAGDPGSVPGDLVPFAAVGAEANGVACFASEAELAEAAAGRDAVLIGACTDAYAEAKIGLVAPGANGMALNTTCEGAPVAEAVSVPCQWSRVDKVQVGTGCQQCIDGCVAEQQTNCQGNIFEGYCAQFDPQVNCMVCSDAFFQPIYCDNPQDQDCYTACTSFCQNIKTTFGLEAVVDKCATDCKAPPVSCTVAPIFEDETVVVGSCETVAAAWGCTISDTTDTLDVSLGGKTVSYVVEKVCNFDGLVEPTEAQCVTAAQCLDADAFATNAGYGPGLSESSGDALCAGATEPLFPVLESNHEDLEATLAACAADIATGALSAPSLSALFGSAGCFDRGRFFLAADRAFAGTRAGQPDPTAEAMGHRMVQGFVQAHTLVATLGLNLYREQLVLGKVADPTAMAVDALDQSMALWPVVLHPRMSGALLALSPEVVRDPDPRSRLGFDAADEVAAARVGLAVDLLEALTDQMLLLDTLLERAWFEGNAARIAERRATAGELLRISAPTGALVFALTEAAAGGEVTWENAWKRTAPRYRQVVETLTRRLDIIASGASPIGIEDEDLPLYYLGDPLLPKERFAAVSLGLLGQGVGSLAIAPKAVTSASEALDQVADTWHERMSVKDINEQRIDDIKYRYGELITGFCGASIENDTNYAGPGMVPCLNPGSQSVFDCPDIDTEVCFVEESCRPRAEAFIEELTSADLAAQLCVFAGLRQVYGANLVGATPAIDEVLRQVGPALGAARAAGEAFPLKITSLELRSANERAAVVEIDGATVEVLLDGLGKLDVKTPASVIKTGGAGGANIPYLQIADGCEASRQLTLTERPVSVPASCTLADECPSGSACREGKCEALSATDPLDSVDCYYDGATAEQAIAVRAAADDIEIARREFDELLEAYDIAKRSCIILGAGNEAIEEQTTSHNKLMEKLDIAKTAAASVAAAAAGVKDCAASFNVDKIITGAVAGVCVAAGVESAANITVEILESNMNEAERQHEEAVLALQNNTDEKICFNDAEMELVGARAALMRIERARQDQSIAVINLRGLKSYTYGLFVEGNEAIAQEEARLERSLPSQFLVSEAAERFARRLSYARRVVYLAERAVEYEFQASLKERQAILAATRPDQLEQAVESLSTWVNSGKVSGGSPDALHAVVSLRSHLLQVGDHTGDPAGQKGLTDVERFRLLLTAPKFGEYDEDGQYLGQTIPFSIAPLGALGLGQSQGVPIVADNDCAERVWSVNAAVLGAGVYEGNESSFTRLDLLKKNTFFSQWCEDPKSGPEFQVASVRPAINLLQDPADPNRHKPEEQDVNDYTRGRMQPYLNVTRADFETEDYAQGATTELAGRGLYGDYALFIPKSVLSLEGSPGLKLERIEDILLRLDYVSVAR